MTKIIRNLVTLAFFLHTGLSMANDSSAELAAGGLVFIKNPNIELRSEELYLSLKKVRVRYVFFNKSSQEVKALIAFPLPDIESYHYDKSFSIFPVDDPVNPFGFTTTINNQKVPMTVHQKAIAKTKDQTSLLKKYNIPLSPQYSKTSAILKKIPKEDWPELQRLGLIWIDEYDQGQGMQKVPQPAWTLQSSFSWLQIFPARKEIVIEHEYQPVVGYTPATSIGASYAVHEKWYPAYIKKYCVDQDLQTTIAQHRKDGVARYSENRLAYILKTGANWAGPIKHFKLVIDKGDSKNLVSFCGQNVKKTGSTTFEINQENFMPFKDLAVLFLVPNKELMQ